MRHRKKVKKLKRVAEHRKALLKNLAKSLLKYERIVTTTIKAKALRPFVEKLITKAKNGTLHKRRQVFSVLEDKKLTSKLFEDIALRYENRNGGYTRIYKLYNRQGDNAQMSMIEMVEEKLEESPVEESASTGEVKEE